MRSSDHPSPEALNAYFDRELPQEQQSSLDAHVEVCAECSGALRAFAALAGLAPEMEPALPGEAYWADLPDRILARIASDPVPVDVSPRGLWARFRLPQAGWRFAVGTLATVALAGGAWWTLSDPTNSSRPEDTVAGNAIPLTGESPLTVTEETPASSVAGVTTSPPVSPEAYNRHVVMTIGNRDNLGTRLDILPGDSKSTFGGSDQGIGTRVTETLPPLAPDLLKEAETAVSYGCGENTLETAYVNAFRAEEEGNYRLAAIGYHAVRSALEPGMPLYQEADYRLNVLDWRDRLQRSYATERAQVLAELHSQMMQALDTYQRTRLDRDCQKAHCITRVFMALGPEVTQPNQLEITQVRMQDLDCR